jgi:hypothetical protein
MARSPDQQRHREILKAVKANTERHEDADRPTALDELRSLFAFLDERIAVEGCHHTMRLTQTFLQDRNLPVNVILEWCKQYGGFCDCEVAANVGSRWESSACGWRGG